jgi:hypothetical protein
MQHLLQLSLKTIESQMGPPSLKIGKTLLSSQGNQLSQSL